MRRRNFLAVLSGAAAWALPTRAQQPAMPTIGFLSGRSPAESATVLAAFRKGLSESGYAESQNVTIDFRWAEGQAGRANVAREISRYCREPEALVGREGDAS